MRIRQMSIEIVVLCLAAGVVGLAANAVHPEGIELTRSYFKLGPQEPRADARAAPEAPPPNPAPRESDPAPMPANGPSSPIESPADNGTTHGQACPSPPQECIIRDEFGLNLACFDFVLINWTAMRNGDPSIVFLDARTQADYEEDHIAGAVLLDHYRQERYLPEVLPRLQNAQAIIVYCAGGDCEDSRFLANSLIFEHSLPSDVVYVYEGGVAEWIAKGKPVEKGGQP